MVDKRELRKFYEELKNRIQEFNQIKNKLQENNKNVNLNDESGRGRVGKEEDKNDRKIISKNRKLLEEFVEGLEQGERENNE